jgi:hypothetical protein
VTAVEGAFGSFKNLPLVNWGIDPHQFIGLVRETFGLRSPRWSRTTFTCSAYGRRPDRSDVAVAVADSA